jgi:hypothetical protein
MEPLKVLIMIENGNNILFKLENELSLNLSTELLDNIFKTLFSINQKPINQPSLIKDMRRPKKHKDKKDFEYKVTPYTIVNHTSRLIIVRRVLDRQNSLGITRSLRTKRTSSNEHVNNESSSDS